MCHFFVYFLDSLWDYCEVVKGEAVMACQKLPIDSDKPVYSWAGHELGSAELTMAKNVASLPFVFKHVSLMPDVHLGKGALVGSVVI
jgi:tRNA-splicing ligase RtcB (3'-phosphate/5'-hydroxy nucleic acid ligase)